MWGARRVEGESGLGRQDFALVESGTSTALGKEKVLTSGTVASKRENTCVHGAQLGRRVLQEQKPITSRRRNSFFFFSSISKPFSKPFKSKLESFCVFDKYHSKHMYHHECTNKLLSLTMNFN